MMTTCAPPLIDEQRSIVRYVLVTSHVIVDALPEQLGLLALPVLEGVDGRSALQG